MFKELYTNANNRIDTKEPYARVMEKLEKAPQRISVVKRVEYVAALAACVCLTFVGVKVYEDGNSFDNPVSEIQKTVWENQGGKADQNADIAEIAPVSDDIVKAEQNAAAPKAEARAKVHTPEPKPQVSAAENAPTATNQPDSADIMQKEAAPLAEKTEDAIVDEPTLQSEEQVENDIMVAAVYSVKSEEISSVSEEDKKMSAGGVGLGRMMPSDTVEMSFSEYCEYIGKTPDMPSGYERISSDVKEFELSEDGNITDDRWTHTYEKGEMRADVTLTKDLSSASHYLDRYETNEIAGVKTVLLSESQNHSAYFIDGNIAYEINVYNMDRTELENIITALVR